jgi:polynucleotide 5'-hydroxyl-kinase GRC3/NOL9
MYRNNDVDTVNLEPGSIIRIEGPANVKVLRGSIYALGTIYSAGSRLTILRTRKVAVKALELTQLDVTLGPEGKVENAEPGEEVLESWAMAAESIMRKGKRVVVLGMMDVGKTTFTIMAMNKAVSYGNVAGVIDADPGQNDLGPPTTIACAKSSKPVTHLSMLPPLKMVFLRTTSLEHTWQEAVNGVAKLVDYLEMHEGVNTTIINTDGWITEATAIQYKLSMLSKLSPDYVVIIQKGEEEELVNQVKKNGFNPILLNAPPLAIKTREDRRLHREMGYGKYLMPAKSATINLSEKPILNLPLSGGVPFDANIRSLASKYLKMPIVYGEQFGKKAIMLSPAVKELVVKAMPGVEVAILPINWENGLLIALEDPDGYLVSLGMLKKIYYESSKAVVIIPTTMEDLRPVDHIRLGMIRLGDNYEEKEKVHYINKLEKVLGERDDLHYG